MRARGVCQYRVTYVPLRFKSNRVLYGGDKTPTIATHGFRLDPITALRFTVDYRSHAEQFENPQGLGFNKG